MSSEQNADQQEMDSNEQNQLTNQQAEEMSSSSSSTEKVPSTSGEAKTAVSTAAADSSKQDTPFFYEDEVFRLTKKGNVKFGLVVETQDTYSGDEDDNEDYDDLNKGDIRVSWYPECDEVIVREEHIGLADRSLMPGDIVRRLVPGKNTQRGFCRDIKLKADVKILGTKNVIKNIGTDRLKSVSNWVNNAAVCLDSWVGSARQVDEIAVLRASSGAKIEVPSDRWHLFYQPKHRPFTENQHFYIGNVVLGKIKDMLYLKKLTPNLTVPTNKKGTARFTVESIRTVAVHVDWQCKALSEDKNAQNSSLQQPERTIVGKDLERLKQINLYDTCLLQLNDRCYMNFSKNDDIIERKAWKAEIFEKYKRILSEQREVLQRLNESGATAPMSNINTLDKLRKKFNLPAENERTCKSKKNFHKIDKNKTKTSNLPNNVDDAEWISEGETEIEMADDKSCTEDVEPNDDETDGSNVSRTTTNSSFKPPSKPCLSYFPRKYCPVAKRSSTSFRKEHNLKDGDQIIVEAMIVYSSINVIWQDGTVEENIPSTQLYPIHHLDSHEYFPGDYVCCTREDINYNVNRDYGVVQRVDHLGRTAVVKWFTVYTTCKGSPQILTPAYNGESEVSVYDLKDHPDFQFRVGAMVIRVSNFSGDDAKCTAGQVTECLTTGQLKVTWVDGHVSNCWPQDLFEVSPYENESDEEESDDSWETESENSEIGIQGDEAAKSQSTYEFFTNMTKASEQISRLQKLFDEQKSEAVSVSVFRKMLVLYKSCRQMDRMMNTNYFYNENFKDNLEQIFFTMKLRILASRRKPKFNAGTMTDGDCTTATDAGDNEWLPNTSSNTTSTPIRGLSSNNNGNSKLTKPNEETQDTEMIVDQQDNAEPVKRVGPLSTNYESPLGPNGHDDSAREPSRFYLVETGDDQILKFQLDEAVGNNTAKPTAPTEGEASSTTTTTQNSGEVATEVSEKKMKMQQCELLVSAVACLEKASEKCHIKKEKKEEVVTPTPSHAHCVIKKRVSKMMKAMEDSGNFSRNDICDSSSLSNESIVSVDITPAELCSHLCYFLKNQLKRCADDLKAKYPKEVDGLAAYEEMLNEIRSESPLEGSDSEMPLQDDEKAALKEFRNELKKFQYERIMNAFDSGSQSTEVDIKSVDTISSEPVAVIPEPLALPSNTELFQILPNAPAYHKFFSQTVTPKNPKTFMSAVAKEHRLLMTSLPSNVWVKSFEDRLDLLSVMIEGPKRTPYEDGLFLFDIQLPNDYPKAPPSCHYISFCSDRLNPNLYDDGKVCVSLLGTWSGKGTEVWTKDSTLLQLIVSIQGLILVSEPYFNEAGYEKQKGTQQGAEYSRMYNEMVILKFIQATTKLILNPPPLFKDIIKNHLKERGLNMFHRFKGFKELSKQTWEDEKDKIFEDYEIPEFPLLPASRGFCLTLEGILNNFYINLCKHILDINEEVMPITSPKPSAHSLKHELNQNETSEPNEKETGRASLAVAEEYSDGFEDTVDENTKC